MPESVILPIIFQGGIFMSFLFNFYAEDGYYSITKAGIITFIVLIVVLLLVSALIKSRPAVENASEDTGKAPTSGSFFSTKQLVFAAMSIAIAFILSYVKLLHMPWGGSVTLCSMLFVVLLGYWYGPKIGLTCALAYGILQFIQGGGGYVLSFWQVAFDYVLAFMALGLSGFFSGKKNGLVKGYIVAVAVRGIMHSIGGYLYWMEYMPDNFPASLSAVYPILYNFAYLIPECIITVVIVSLPPVKKALDSLYGIVKD